MDEVVLAFLENEQKLRVVKRLGRGGFAEVYEVESPSRIRSAVKVSLDPIDGNNPAVKKELENLNVVKAITGHPHIVSLLDCWVVGDRLVTRWELASDGSLLEKLAEYQKQGQKGIPQELLLEWMKEAAEAVDFLNSKGIYHRDIKPSNLLLFHGHVKIADLGLAKVVGASTASHTGSGTMSYIPLEAWQEHRLTPTVDLYSLAATYVKLRTGEEPFGRTPEEMVERQKSGNPVVRGLGPEEVEFVRWALAARPEERPQEGAVAWVRSVSERVQEERRPKPVAPPAPIPAPTARPQTIEHDTSNGAGTIGVIKRAIVGAIVVAIVGGIGGAIYVAILVAIVRSFVWAIWGAIFGAIVGATKGWIEGAIEGGIKKGAIVGAIVVAILMSIEEAIVGAMLGAIAGAILGAMLGAIVGAISRRSERVLSDLLRGIDGD